MWKYFFISMAKLELLPPSVLIEILLKMFKIRMKSGF